MTIAVDWDLNYQTKQKQTNNTCFRLGLMVLIFIALLSSISTFSLSHQVLYGDEDVHGQILQKNAEDDI